MDDERHTARELWQSALLGAVAFPALLALLAVMYPIANVATVDLLPDAAWVVVLVALSAIAHGAALGFAVGLAHVGGARGDTRKPRHRAIDDGR